MELAEAYNLIEIFREKAAAKRWEERLAMQQQVQFEDDRKKKHEKQVREKEEHQLEELVLASVQQIEMFNQQLDTYDTATVRALMDNDVALDAIRRTREALEAGAYRMPDGQIAIKSDDGKRVLDRHGVELSPGTIEPSAIPDSLPRWSAFKAADDAQEKLTRERHDILLYQERLDAAREAASRGHITADALADMGDDLRRSMPNAVQANLPDAAVARKAPTVQGNRSTRCLQASGGSGPGHRRAVNRLNSVCGAGAFMSKVSRNDGLRSLQHPAHVPDELAQRAQLGRRNHETGQFGPRDAFGRSHCQHGQQPPAGRKDLDPFSRRGCQGGPSEQVEHMAGALLAGSLIFDKAPPISRQSADGLRL